MSAPAPMLKVGYGRTHDQASDDVQVKRKFHFTLRSSGTAL